MKTISKETLTQLQKNGFEIFSVDSKLPNIEFVINIIFAKYLENIESFEYLENLYRILIPDVYPSCGGCQNECTIIETNDSECYYCNFRNFTDDFLMGGFVEKIFRWFYKFNYEIYLFKDENYDLSKVNFKIRNYSNKINIIGDYYENPQQAKHYAILKMFELLKCVV